MALHAAQIKFYVMFENFLYKFLGDSLDSL